MLQQTSIPIGGALSTRKTLIRGARVLAICLGVASVSACMGHGSRARVARATPATAIGVNSYLWRATLDTLAFMPLLSADPYGGVVNTDWYINPEKPNERFKVTVYILDSRLRADGLNVAVFKEVSNGAGGWITAPTADQTSTDFENSILTKARQLRLSNLRG